MLKMRKIKLTEVMLLSAAFLFLFGCTPERKIASEYLSSRKDISIVLKAPQWLKIDNQISDSINVLPDYTQQQKDSIIAVKTKIIPHVSESSLLKSYTLSLKRGLESMGYRTYLAGSQDTVFPVKSAAIFINIGQVELDESSIPVRDEVSYQKKLYVADYDLTKIELCFWLELNRLENGVPAKSPRVFYTSFEKMEEVDGDFYFDEVKDQMDYYSARQELSPEFVEGAIIKLGYEHASGLNTLLMNEYIGYKLPDKKNRQLFAVDKQYGIIYGIDKLPFYELNKQP